MKVILASASPRRQELLKNIFPSFTVHSSSCEENAAFETPSQYVMDLASQKAAEVASHYGASSNSSLPDEETLIIGADTIVYHRGAILGKPSDRDDALRMLGALSGQSHEVYTGVSLIHIKANSTNTYTTYACTKVHVNPLSKQEIDHYIDGPENIFDKAGSYAIQGSFSRHISGIEGDYFNVVGLPVNKIYELLKENYLI